MKAKAKAKQKSRKLRAILADLRRLHPDKAELLNEAETHLKQKGVLK